MQKYNVRWSIAAMADIKATKEYIEQTFSDPVNAKKIAQKIINKGDSLKIFPKAERVRMSLNGKELRFAHAGKYTLIYYIDEDSSTVLIRNVLYSRRNIMQLLAEDFE